MGLFDYSFNARQEVKPHKKKWWHQLLTLKGFGLVLLVIVALPFIILFFLIKPTGTLPLTLIKWAILAFIVYGIFQHFGLAN